MVMNILFTSLVALMLDSLLKKYAATENITMGQLLNDVQLKQNVLFCINTVKGGKGNEIMVYP